MSYRPSKARQTFSWRSLSLLREAKIAADPAIPRAPRQLALQGAIVQTHSAFEEYVGEFVDDWASERVAAMAPARELPQRLRSWLLHAGQVNAYEKFLLKGEERPILGILDRGSDPLRYFMDDGAVDRIPVDRILEERRYPSFSNLRVLFYRLGFDNLAAHFGRALRTDASRYFDAFSSIRNNISHHTAVPITYRDVLDFSRRGRKIVSLLDTAFYQSLVVNTGSTIWPM